MNSLKKVFLIGTTVASLAGASFAVQAQQGPGMGAGGPGASAQADRAQQDPAARQARFKEHMAKRQAALHDKLKLNQNQEAAWNTYIAAMTPAQMQQRPNRADWEKLTAPQRMEQHLAMMKQHESRMTSKLEATKTFYAALTPEQRKVFDAETMHGGRHGHGHGGKDHGRHGAGADGRGAGNPPAGAPR